MKRFLTVCLIIIALGITGAYLVLYTSFTPFSKLEEDPEYFMTVKGKEIFHVTGETEERFEIKGVDLGAGIPGAFATEFAIDYDTYMEWFRLIQEMNANVIRVYTISDPEFYHAFYDYNVDNPKPLYLLHGVWVDDEVIRGAYDAYVSQFIDVFGEDCEKLVDLLHGRRNIWYNSRHGYGAYKWDVSQWVAGYIIGVEWDPDIVLYTGDIREYMAAFEGTFLYTDENATAYEAMLARVGDRMLTYEMRKYGEQKLLAFSNWPETDPLDHEQWRLEANTNLAKIDVEHIHGKENLKTGMFASYHIYPYYPAFLDFEETYAAYIDEEGGNNPYQGYLKAINDHHTIPVVVSEFGLPSSRGIARINEARGMNQGHLSEEEQAKRLKVLYRDIKTAGCAGAVVFAWQDEWFKRTWNTWPGVNLTRNAYWSDYQTNEQSFGMITFDPGEEESIVYVDGDVEEWEDVPWLIRDENSGLQAAYDEKFVYFHVYVENLSRGDVIYLPVDITPNSGAYRDAESGLEFSQPVDFLIRLDGKYNSAMLVQEYYDLLFATERREIWEEDAFIHPPAKDSQKFNLIQQFLRGKIMMLNGEVLSPWLFPTGELLHGNANPKDEEFNSLADFYMEGDHIELRLPWTLFNFSDPSQMRIHDDYYAHYGVEEMEISSMDVSMQVLQDGKTSVKPFGTLKLKGWGNHPTWHMRLKDAYYAMQEVYGEAG